MTFCERCKNWISHRSGKCPCTEYVVIGADEEEYKFFARNHEDAAISYAKYYNRDDYALMDETMDITVVAPDGVRIEFVIGAEPDVHYFANENSEKQKELTTKQ